MHNLCPQRILSKRLSITTSPHMKTSFACSYCPRLGFLKCFHSKYATPTSIAKPTAPPTDAPAIFPVDQDSPPCVFDDPDPVGVVVAPLEVVAVAVVVVKVVASAVESVVADAVDVAVDPILLSVQCWPGVSPPTSFG